MVGVDGSEGAARAATVAFEIGELTKSKVYIVYIIPLPNIKHISVMSDVSEEELLQKYEFNGKKILQGYNTWKGLLFRKSKRVGHNKKNNQHIHGGVEMITIRDYVERLFRNIPDNESTRNMRQEIIQNLQKLIEIII